MFFAAPAVAVAGVPPHWYADHPTIINTLACVHAPPVLSVDVLNYVLFVHFFLHYYYYPAVADVVVAVAAAAVLMWWYYYAWWHDI